MFAQLRDAALRTGWSSAVADEAIGIGEERIEYTPTATEPKSHVALGNYLGRTAIVELTTGEPIEYVSDRNLMGLKLAQWEEHFRSVKR